MKKQSTLTRAHCEEQKAGRWCKNGGHTDSGIVVKTSTCHCTRCSECTLTFLAATHNSTYYNTILMSRKIDLELDLDTWLAISSIANEEVDGDISTTIEILCTEAMEQRGRGV